MDKILNEFTSFLKNQKDTDLDLTIARIENLIEDTQGEKKYDRSIYNPILRTLYSLRSNRLLDFLGNFRQVMMYFGLSFEIDLELFNKIQQYKDYFGMELTINPLTIRINPTILSGVKDLESQFIMKKRRKSFENLGDGLFYKELGFTTYSSLAQKILNYYVSCMKPKQTLLACLPTGGGKSLAWQIPAISDNLDGLIIVVVPTTALALDHEKSSKKFFAKRFGTDVFPKAYYGSLDKKSKIQLFNEIEKGVLPLLYISPEALVHEEFKTRIQAAADKGKVYSIFIDEAHLLIGWGSKFRPEFQFLSSFINKLNNGDRLGVKTILLSATYTDDEIRMIKSIFNFGDFIELRSDELRSEPTYYIKKYNDQKKRLDDAILLVCQAPKPIIIYTLNPNQAGFYHQELNKFGFKNIEIFTGNTLDQDRKRIINDWNDNKIDIIVATSAFGMGVDKTDIRTIINVYQSESISRFYQEVGRSGRDGYASLSYLLAFPEEDEKGVLDLIKSSLLTPKNIVDRWSKLCKKVEAVSGKAILIDTSTKPDRLEGEITGGLNSNWNEFVILFMNRNGLIKLVDIKENAGSYKVMVELERLDVLESKPKLLETVTNYRDIEWERILRNKQRMTQLIRMNKEKCISSFLNEEYPFTLPVCSGCPYCRSKGKHSYKSSSQLLISSRSGTYLDYQKYYTDEFDNFIYVNRIVELKLKDFKKESLLDCVQFLVIRDVNILVVPEIVYNKDLLEKLKMELKHKYLIFSEKEIKDLNFAWIPGIMAIFIDSQNTNSNVLFTMGEDYASIDNNNKVIYVTENEIFIKSRVKPLSEIVDQNLEMSQFQ